MVDSKGRYETFLTLVLEDQSSELAAAHRDLYPERIPEQIPLSLTLLYPWIPADSVSEDELARVRQFFRVRPALTFQLTRLDQFPGIVVYAVPEPDDDLRRLMRELWAAYPDYPPYGELGGDPPPHCTLGRLEGDYAISFRQVAERVEPLLPVSCSVDEVTLMEEYEPDRCRVRERFKLGCA